MPESVSANAASVAVSAGFIGTRTIPALATAYSVTIRSTEFAAPSGLHRGLVEHGSDLPQSRH